MMTSDPEKLEMNSAERPRTDHYLKRGCFCTSTWTLRFGGLELRGSGFELTCWRTGYRAVAWRSTINVLIFCILPLCIINTKYDEMKKISGLDKCRKKL